MTDLTKLSLTAAKKGLTEKKFSSTELVQAHIERIEQTRHLNAYVTDNFEGALAQAKESEARYASSKAGKLEGLPIGIKDLFCTKNLRTTAGSKILGNFVPPYESTVTQNLLDAGAVFLGKTNMDEFAMGSSNLTSWFGPCVSPWKRTHDNKDLVPGGSSGGSASAVAADIALAATASDTGGSIRQPAAFTGTVGIKPTYGLCSRYGMVAFASSLDQAGPIAKTVHDAALMLEVMASYDVKDSTSLNVKVPEYSKHITPNIKGLRVGLVKEYLTGLNAEVQALVDQGIAWLKEAGCTFKEMSLPTTPYALPTYYIIAPAEASTNLARYDGLKYGLRVDGETLDDMYERTRREGFGEEVRRRIMIGTYVLSAGYFDAYYLKAQKIQTLIAQDFDRAFQDVDVIFTPTTPGASFALDESPADPVTMYLNDIFTVTVNLAGLPGISVPAGLSKEGLPLGLQFIGPRLSEQTLFNAAHAIEVAADFKNKTDALKRI